MPKRRIEVNFKANEGPSKATVIVEVPSYNVPSAPRFRLRRPLVKPLITKTVSVEQSPIDTTPIVEEKLIPTIIEVSYGPEQYAEEVVQPVIENVLEEYDSGAPADKGYPFLRGSQTP